MNFHFVKKQQDFHVLQIIAVFVSFIRLTALSSSFLYVFECLNWFSLIKNRYTLVSNNFHWRHSYYINLLHNFVLWFRIMWNFIINVNKRSFNISQSFKLLLERFRYIMCFLYRHFRCQYYINFHEKVMAKVKGPDSINLLYFLVMIYTDPRDFTDECCGSCVAD